MKQNLNVALVGAWHVHADDYARDCANNPHTTLVAVWDDDGSRGESAAQRWSVSIVPSLDSLLADPEIDGVIVTTSTASHHDVMLKAAAAGKHIYTEKVLADTTSQAEDIVAAARSAGVILTVSLPRLYTGYTAAIDRILADRVLGEVSYVRVRVSHDGAIRHDGDPQWLPEHFFDRAEARGGAMIDFGAHPYYLLHHFAGMPHAVTAHFLSTSGHDVEDQALVVLDYPGTLTGVAEASFLGGSIGMLIEIHGSEGSLLYDFDNGLRTRVRGEQSWQQREIEPDGPTPFDRWVDAIHAGSWDDANVSAALALTILAEAAERSAAERRTVQVEP